jgi:nitroimidazol reductase NimA-like FMN-containing flavoprotein (pyridoxamine 5'-phosphate oxidase superfamily)
MKFSSSVVQNYLKSQRLGRLATITPKGLPHIVAVAYVNDDTNLYFTTFTETKKVRNLHGNCKVAFIVDDSGGSAGWRYVTVEGDGYVILDLENFDAARELLCEKYPVYLTEEWEIKPERNSIIRIEPRRVITANIDN